MGAIISSVVAFLADLLKRVTGHRDAKPVRSKFEAEDGITLYSAVGSPCSRRVRIALQAKGLKWNTVSINLLIGEQKCDEYMKVNSQGKVPAVTFSNIKEIPNCTLVESNVITEFVDSQLPGEMTLYPSDLWERTQVKMWMDWEQSLAEDFLPLLTNNFLPFLIRLLHRSRDHFISSLPKYVPKAVRQKNINLYDGIGLKDADELKLSAIGCYRALLRMEKALDGQEFLVGKRFTVADLSVYPRLAYFEMVGLPIPEKDFPNTYAYLNRLGNMPCVSDSSSFGDKITAFFFSYLPWLPVTFGNLKAGKTQERYDGGQVIERVLGEELERRRFDLPLPEIPPDQVVLFDYTCAPECWQTQLLLLEKGKSFKTVEGDFLEVVGRPHGSEGVFRIQHGEHVVVGRRAQLEYLDWATGGPSLLSNESHQRAQVLKWQGWEEAMHTAHIYPLMQTTLLPSMFKERFSPDQADDLLRLRSDPFYSIRFPDILRIYAQRWEPGSDILRQLSGIYGNLERDPDVEEQKTLEHHWELHRCLEHLDGQLQDRDFLVGGSVSLADVCVFCRLLLMPYIGMKISAQKYPNVGRWMTLLWEREPFMVVATQVTENLDKYMFV